jgi:hypothetical protein
MPDALARALVGDVEEILGPPLQLRGGNDRVMLQSVELGAVTDRHLVAKVRLRYQKRRGFPKYSTSGVAHARFTIYPGNNGEMCLSDLAVERVEMNRVPKWLDGKWVAKRLQGRLPGEVCAK